MENISSGLRAVQTASSLDLDVLKVPKGFIKLVQIILCILAFSVLSAYDSRLVFEKGCQPVNGVDQKAFSAFKFGYPFDLSEHGVSLPLCRNESADYKQEKFQFMHDNLTSTPRFFVFTGVISFIYAMCILVCYVFITPTMEAHDGFGYKIDILIHLVLCLFWFCGSFALIKTKSDVETWTSSKAIFSQLECDSEAEFKCTVTSEPKYGAIGFAIGMGFVNLFAWGSNIYFLLKDTPEWFDKLFGRWKSESNSSQRYARDPYATNTSPSATSEGGQQQVPPY